MRIGILTLELKLNYGGILQAYALQTTIKRMGYDAFVINRQSGSISKIRNALFIVKRLIRKYILGNDKTIVFIEKKAKNEYPEIAKNILPFIERNISLFNVEDYRCLNESDFDAYVVGSDQVWRPKYFKDIENAYLAFALNWNVKKIAYAPSFGTDIWEYSKIQTENCKKLINLFDAVSIRESSGVNLCSEYLNAKALKVLDPTLLLSKENYITLFKGQDVPRVCSGIFVYYLDNSEFKESVMREVENNLKLDVFRIKAQINDLHLPLCERIQEPVERWISSFYDAEYVLTDSFHGCVFSIIFNKSFIVCGNKQRGYSRFVSLLSLFGLENRLVDNVDDVELVLNQPIDWNKINNLLAKYRNESIQFLSQSLKS